MKNHLQLTNELRGRFWIFQNVWFKGRLWTIGTLLVGNRVIWLRVKVRFIISSEFLVQFRVHFRSTSGLFSVHFRSTVQMINLKSEFDHFVSKISATGVYRRPTISSCTTRWTASGHATANGSSPTSANVYWRGKGRSIRWIKCFGGSNISRNRPFGESMISSNWFYYFRTWIK